MARATQVLLFSLISIADSRLNEKLSMPSCPPANFTTVKNFDLDTFIQSRWYIHQQMPTTFLPATENRCVYADYKMQAKNTLWGYDVSVHNYAEDNAAPHKVHDSGTYICAKVVDAPRGKLEVAPCFLPKYFAGDYWVLDWSEQEGYALISGGAPKNSAEGGCQMGSGATGSGLWIFTRQQKRDEALVQKVRGVAARIGFDLSVLNDVDQTDCKNDLIV